MAKIEHVNFALSNVSHLRYFMPIVEELSRVNISSLFYLFKIDRCSCPYKSINKVRELSNKYGFKTLDSTEAQNATGTTFFAEGSGITMFSKKIKSISLVTLTDFRIHYSHYVNRVDKVIFPSKFFAEFYKTTGPKNLYIGCPKYDVVIDPKNVRNKYNLTDKKYALVLFPRYRDLKKINLLNIYKYLEQMGYSVILKARNKEPANKKVRPKIYFEDTSWYPHTTMELISLSDIIINFDSTAIKECVMLKKPVLNYNIKPHKVIPMQFLYNYDYCLSFKGNMDFNEFKSAVEHLVLGDFSLAFEKSISNHLFKSGNVSKNIIEEVVYG